MLTQRQHRNFWAKVVVDPQGCWRWTAGIGKSGYGAFKVGNRMEGAHRLSYAIANGPIPGGEGYHGTCVLHKCDNRACVRPDHLFLGTARDNAHDRGAKDRAFYRPGLRSPTCVHSAETRARVFELRATGLSQDAIAARTGMSQSHVSRILRKLQRVES